MKINNLVIGIIVIVLAALLLADGIISYVDASKQMFSLADVKGIAGVVFLVLAASFLKAAKE
jgi:predicted small secreted protein